MQVVGLVQAPGTGMVILTTLLDLVLLTATDITTTSITTTLPRLFGTLHPDEIADPCKWPATTAR
jgi:hypothetical protein